MGELLLIAFSHPMIFANQIPFLLSAGFVMALITWVFMTLAGKWIMWFNRPAGLIAGTVFVPILIVLIAVVLFTIGQKTSPSGDLPGMMFIMMVVVSVSALPFSLIATAIYVTRNRRRNAR